MALIGTFNTEFSLNEVSFDTESSLDVQEVNFNTCFLNGRVLRTGKILSATTAYWNSKPGLITETNTIYIYTDYRQEEKQGEIVNIPGLKIGDGLAYLIDIPFIDESEELSDSKALEIFWHDTPASINNFVVEVSI